MSTSMTDPIPAPVASPAPAMSNNGNTLKKASKDSVRVEWTPARTEEFVDLLLAHKAKHEGDADQSIPKAAWDAMAEHLATTYSTPYNAQNLKSQFYILKNQWKAVSRARLDSRFDWDDEKKALRAEPEAWKEYLASLTERDQKILHKFQTVPLPLFDKLTELWGPYVEPPEEPKVLPPVTAAPSLTKPPTESTEAGTEAQAAPKKKSKKHKRTPTAAEENRQPLTEEPVMEPSMKRARQAVPSPAMEGVVDPHEHNVRRAMAWLNHETQQVAPEARKTLFVQTAFAFCDPRLCTAFLALPEPYRMPWLSELLTSGNPFANRVPAGSS